MRYLSLFSGIEAATVAWHPLGWAPLAFCEVNPFASAVLAHHWPSVPNLGDVEAVDWSAWRGMVDVFVGGPPCQAFSVAGLRGSLGDHRGNLSLQYVRALHATDPTWSVTENVPGWLSTRDNAFGCFLAGLVGEDDALEPTGGRWTDAGMVTGPERVAAWRTLDAQYFGLAQRRRRVFVVSCRVGDGDPGAVLFERESVRRHSPPSREAGEDPARCLTAGTGQRYDAETDDLIPVAFDWTATGHQTASMALEHDLSPTMKSGTTMAVHAFDARQSDVIQYGPISGPLDTDGHTIGVRTGSSVRRLTPTECERLQGFPDRHTAIPWRGASAKNCPDGPRYRAIGNSMAVPVMAWIGRRIAAVEAA